MKSLFYIPERNEEVKALINTIVKRNCKESDVPKIDFIYVITLLEEYYQREIVGLQDEIHYLNGGRIPCKNGMLQEE